MDGPEVARSRPRWRRVWMVTAVVFAALTVAALAVVPGSVRTHQAYRDRAVVVEATITDRDCSPAYPGMICVNVVRYRYEGEDHLVRRSRWNRPVGDRFEIAVDPDDPDRFEVADLGGGEGTLWTLGAFASLTAAVLAATAAVGRRETVSDGTSVVFHHVPSRWASVPVVAFVTAVAGAIATGVFGWTDSSGVAATCAAALLGAAGTLLWQQRRPDRLVLAGGAVTALDRSGRVVRSITLGPGATWTRARTKSLTGVVFRGPDGRLTVWGHAWGVDGTDTLRRLVTAAEHHGTVASGSG